LPPACRHLCRPWWSSPSRPASRAPSAAVLGSEVLCVC
jgi:hypothetical protein